eukprot:COSAG02_NODE_4228_length_5609_cov_2.984395_3_plen_101_part_00
MPVVVKYGGDGLRYPLHRAACQGDDAGLERLLHALRSGTPVPTEELKGGNTGCVNRIHSLPALLCACVYVSSILRVQGQRRGRVAGIGIGTGARGGCWAG